MNVWNIGARPNWRALPIGLVAAVVVAAPLLANTVYASDGGGWRTTVSHCGKASWYGGKWAGRKTANGEIYDPQTLTAAHKTLPFGTRVRVRREGGGRSVIVRINNRGPYIKGRIIDLSEKAAEALAFKGAGVTRVCVAVMDR